MKQTNASRGHFTSFLESLRTLGVLSLALAVVLIVSPQPVARADTASDIQQKIAEQNAKIAELEKEIAQYENTLNQIGTQKTTLQNEVSRIDVSRKKVSTDIAVSEKKITASNLQLQKLGGAITDKAKRIQTSTQTIASSLRTLRAIGESTLVEMIFASDGIEEAWVEIDKLGQLTSSLGVEVQDLEDTKKSLTIDYGQTEKQKATLVSLKKQLSDQKILLDQTRQEQADLLSQTKNKETEYQKLLATKRAAKIEFEKQLGDYEASLKYTLDPKAIPKAGSGVLSFPLDPSFMGRCKDRTSAFKNIYCITQYFGNTAFAQSGAYNGKGHNGIDFGSPEGTKVVSALGGTVLGTGNTDAYPGCYSYGKWVYVEHPNGLGTIYAHLSVISVIKGQTVGTGDLLGYSGKTGYATGPHLHFSVYVANAVKIIRLGDAKIKTNCANALMPVAPTEAYLNPMQYL